MNEFAFRQAKAAHAHFSLYDGLSSFTADILNHDNSQIDILLKNIHQRRDDQGKAIGFAPDSKSNLRRNRGCTNPVLFLSMTRKTNLKTLLLWRRDLVTHIHQVWADVGFVHIIPISCCYFGFLQFLEKWPACLPL